ncbi:hypothetical protein [Bacillus sp. FJAT-47783]|uniref:hypothetical protein n=1 Tax=Bacillus sp. FJAT-47783 TaxID=2922712 RepID=UPI001FAB9754|nr:hypothetical protein [Bacillus sp. FJAT-47783]
MDASNEPNNRYNAFCDLAYLENYVRSNELDFVVFIVGTDHLHYVNQKTYSNATGDFDLRDGSMYEAGRELINRNEKTYGTSTMLKDSYQFQWDKARGINS